MTPKPVEFVRFKHDRVVRLEVAALGKPVEVHDKNEVGEEPGPTLEARTITNGDQHAGPEGTRPAAPTLKRPGDTDETVNTPGMGKVVVPKN